ncbi:MAG: periplasmic heavy metal sensor [Azospirillaceae bacterium]|nr:periplasmic heavy metal sensor [Azospirillaceae bacterium]
MTFFSSRWRGPLLIASVGVNLFLAGTVVPHLFRHHDVPGREPGPGLNFHPRPLSDFLSPSDAEILEKAISPDRIDFQALDKQAREAWAESQRLLAADTFDAPAFAHVMAQVAEGRRSFEESRHASLVDALSKMSPEGRRKLAEMKVPFVLGGGPHGPWGPDDRRDHGPDGRGPDGRFDGPGPDGRFDHPPHDGNDAATPHNDGGIPLTPRAPTAAPVPSGDATPH